MARKATGTVQWSGDHWRARVTLADGSRPWLDLPSSIGADEREKARAKAAELAAYVREHGYQRADGGELVGDNETVSEFVERWLRDREQRGFRSVRDDRQRLYTHALPVLGALAVRAVAAKDLRAFVATLDAKIRAGALAATTARKAWGLVAKLFADAQGSKVEALRIREDNPAAGVAPPDSAPAKAKAYLYPSEFLALVGCEHVAVRWRRIYALAVYTYARAGELEALTVDAVNLEHGVIHIHHAIARTGERRETKTGETRRVRIEPNLRPLLEALTRGRAGDDRVVTMPPREDGAANLRRHLQLAGVTRADLFADDATRIPLTFHDLRATGITWRAVRGDDALKIQRDAGHTSLDTTQRYIREASVYAEGFGEVFPVLPRSLLVGEPDGPGEGDGGDGRALPRSASLRRVLSKQSSKRSESACKNTDGHTSYPAELRSTTSLFSGGKGGVTGVSPLPKHPGSPRSVQAGDDCGTVREPRVSSPRAVLVAALGEAVRAGLEAGDARLVQVAARALGELMDPTDGPVIDLATERARRGER
ncbi:MAG: site-specific integrase [Polyangiales bacterium]